MVVHRIAIEVVNLWQLLRVGDECFGNQTMNFVLDTNTFIRQYDSFVTGPHDFGTKDQL